MIVLLILLLLLLSAAGWYLRRRAKDRAGSVSERRFVRFSNMAYGAAGAVLIFLLGYLAGVS